MSRWGINVIRVLDHLEHVGPATLAELSVALGLHRDQLSVVLHRLHTAGKREPRRIYISAWTREVIGQRTYPRAVYALGDKRDAKRPAPISGAEANRRYRERQNAKALATAFHLGVTRREREQRAAAVRCQHGD